MKFVDPEDLIVWVGNCLKDPKKQPDFIKTFLKDPVFTLWSCTTTDLNFYVLEFFIVKALTRNQLVLWARVLNVESDTILSDYNGRPNYRYPIVYTSN